MIDLNLISIPAGPIREQWVRRYRMIEKKLEKMKRDWRLYEQEAFPKFQAWYHYTFSQDLTLVNEWSEKAREIELIFSAVVAHQKIHSLNQLEAYSRVRKLLRQKKDLYPDAADIEAFHQHERDREEAEKKRREEKLQKLKEEQLRFWDSDEEEKAYQDAVNARTARQRGAQETFKEISEAVEPPSPTREKHEDDLRTIYRKIVRALHPDSGHEMSAIEKEWWNQAQVAYKRRDRDALKLIALKIEGSGVVPIESIEHISTIIEMCASLFEQQDEIQFQKKRMKKHSVYRFWTSRDRPANRAKLKVELHAQLSYQYRRLRSFIEESKQLFQQMDDALRGGGESSTDDSRTWNRGRSRGRRK